MQKLRFGHLLAVLIVMTLLSGCATVSGQQGTENVWRNADAPQWVVGKTTEQDVLAALGPPSQLIPLHDDTVYYYMLEKSKTRIMVLFVYNQSRSNVTYDRAMFIFDKGGILKKYSLSAVPADAKK